MLDIKTIISLIAISLAIIGYTPYLYDTFKGKTTPHLYTWFIWGLVAAIEFALQISGGAGVGSWLALTISSTCFLIFILGLRNGKKDITRSDSICLILSLFALFLWIIAKQPILSVILVTSVDVIGFIPTIRKSWEKPYSETLFTYELAAFRNFLNIFALQKYSILTWLYPIVWTIVCALFSLLLIMRRKQMKKT